MDACSAASKGVTRADWKVDSKAAWLDHCWAARWVSGSAVTRVDRTAAHLACHWVASKVSTRAVPMVVATAEKWALLKAARTDVHSADQRAVWRAAQRVASSVDN